MTQDPNSNRKMPPCPKYENLRPPHPSTRATDSLPCECTVCQIARLNRPPGAGGYTELPVLFKALIFPDQPSNAPSSPDTIKLCKKCLTVLARGKRHICTKTEMRSNLAGIVKSKSRKSRGKVVAASLKTIFDDQGVQQKGGTASLPTGGTPIQVTMGSLNNRKFTRKAPRWSHDSLKRLQASMNLSDRAIK